MATNQGMSGFVQKQNPSMGQGSHQPKEGNGVQSAEDLKFPISRGRKRTPHQSRDSNSGAARRYGSRGRISSEHDGGKPFYGTTAHSLEDLSTTASTKRNQVHALQEIRDPHLPSDQEHSSFGDNESEQSLPADPPSEEAQRGPVKQESAVKQEALELDGIARHYMPGDSYPPTTSGRPSEIYEDDRSQAPMHDPRGQVQQQVYVAPQTKARTRGQQQRALPQNAVQQPLNPTGPSHPQHTGGSPTPVAHVTDVVQAVNAGFSFGMPVPSKGAARGNAFVAAKQSPDVPDPKSYDASNKTRQAAPPIDLAPTSTQPPPAQGRIEAVNRYPGAPQPAHHRQGGNTKMSPQRREWKAPAHPQPQTAAIVQPHQRPQLPRQELQDKTEGEEQEDENALDYELDDLVDMNLDEVQAESFDVDPTVEELQLPPECAQADLKQKMATLMRYEPQLQVEFFESLSLSDWELAGDYFLGQFGEIFQQLKAVRQERRNTAATFEREVKQRHDLVGQKRKAIDDAMGEMKESGDKILAGTPKKKSKKK